VNNEENIHPYYVRTSVFLIRDGSWVKNPTATADTDENDNRLRYSYKLKYYTLCDPPEKLHDPLAKKVNWDTACNKMELLRL